MKGIIGAVVFLLSGSLMGSWLQFVEEADKETRFSIIRSTPQEIVIDIQVPGIAYEEIDTEEGRFIRLSGTGGLTGKIGQPELPAITRLIEIPQSALVKIELQDIHLQEYSLSELGIFHPIYPVQHPVPKSGTDQVRFEIDRLAYQSDRFFPEEVYRSTDIVQIRGVRLMPLIITPIQYNPAKDIIRVTKRIRVRLILTGSDLSYTNQKKERYYSPYFDRVLKKKIINYESPKGVPQLPVGYLIITYDNFYNNILPFADWKRKKGFNVTVTRTGEIPGGPTAANIKSYIQNAYDTWTIPPTFGLLVGDVAEIPASQLGAETGVVTDLYYFTVDGTDYFPDIFYGRFSGSTGAHIDVMVDKVVQYERNLWTEGTAWLGKMYFIASDDPRHHHEVELISRICMALARSYGVICDSLFLYYGTGTPIPTAVNEGRALTLFTGHGSRTSWADPGFGQSHVQALTNNDKYSLVIGHACFTGDFSVPECFAETWTRAENKGGVAYFGCAPVAWWVWDDTLQIGWFRPMFIEPTTNFLGGFFQLGLFNVWEWMHASQPGGVQHYYEGYHIFGDPSMNFYTLEPIPLTVNYPGFLPIGSHSFTVNVAEDSALVALYREGTLYGVAYSSGGAAVIALNPPPIEEGWMHVTITKHNYLTYEDSVAIMVPTTVTIEPDTISVDTPTWVYITVIDDTLAPVPDVEVKIFGYGVMPPIVDTTNSVGVCSLLISAPYGEVLTVTGRIITESWMLFAEPLWVIGASDFTSVSLSCSVSALGLIDTLAPLYRGRIDAVVSPPGFRLFVSGAGIDTSAYYDGGTAQMIVFPMSSGEVTVCIAKPGYNIHKEFFPVKELFGRLSGTVRDSITDSLIGGALVRIYDITNMLVFEAETNDSGLYIVPDSLPVGYYDIEITAFTYQEYSDRFPLFSGHNIKDAFLVHGDMVLLSGLVNLKDRGDNSGVTISARYKEHLFSTMSDERGNYLLYVPPGALFSVWAQKDGYTEEKKDSISVPQDNINFTLYPIMTLYFSDFEDNDGLLTGTSDWQWGISTYGPDSAHSGERLWATGLGTNYSNNSDSRLTTPEIVLPGMAPYINLSFWHWYNTESFWDGGNVKLSTGGPFTVIEPVGGYPEDAVSSGNRGIPDEPAYSGWSDGWRKALFDLSTYTGDTVQLMFHFGSDASITEPGWYLDDIWVGYVDSTGINDVGVVAILLPDTVWQDSVYIPSATVYNYGATESPFPVMFSIGDYVDTVFAAVPQDTGIVIEFTNWIPRGGGTTVIARVETKLDGDQWTPNNIIEKEIYIAQPAGVAETIPCVYALYHIGPNPFEQTTEIKYAVPRRSKISLEIYNLLGQRVILLDSGIRDPGTHYREWDGKCQRGMEVARGVYFIRFTSGDFRSVKKIVKIR